MELTNWQRLSDRGRDLVLCLDFATGPDSAAFTPLATAPVVDFCFLHIRQTGFGQDLGSAERLDAYARQWAREALETGRTLCAVLGYRAGGALATSVADTIAAAGPAPAVILFDATAVTGAVLCDEFIAAVESSSQHLTADEVADACRWSAELAGTCPGDLPRIAAGLAGRYDQLMAGFAQRQSLTEFQRELTEGFTAYLAYLLLASQGELTMRTGAPLFLSSRDHELPAEHAKNISLDVGRAELLRDNEVIKLVADMLRGEHSW